MSDQVTPLSERAQAFADTYLQVAALTELARQSDAEPAVYEEPLRTGRLILSLLEEDAASELTAMVTDVARDPAYKEREALAQLREHPLYVAGTLTEEDIVGRIARLPGPKYTTEAMAFAERYFGDIGHYLTGQEASVVPLPSITTGEAPVATDTPEPIDDTGPNKEPAAARIVVYKDHAMSINGGTPVSLIRQMELMPGGLEGELEIADLRAKAMEFLAQQPDGSRHRTSKVWAAITEKPYTTLQGLAIWDFLSSLEMDGQPLFTVWKPSPEAKRRYLSTTDLSVSVEFSDEKSDLYDLNVFRLPNGLFLLGRKARIAHAFLAANEENPFTEDDFERAGWYTEEERAAMRSAPTLSSAASILRSSLSELGVDELFAVHTVRTFTKEEGRKVAYWLEKKTPAEDVATPEATEGSPELLSKADARIVAAWLAKFDPVLQEASIPLLPAIDREKLSNGEVASDEFDLPRIIAVIKHLDDALHDDTKTEKFLINQIPPGDIRWALIDYLSSPALNGDAELVIDQLMDAIPDINFPVWETYVGSVFQASNWDLTNEANKKEYAENISRSVTAMTKAVIGLGDHIAISRFSSSQISAVSETMLQGIIPENNVLHALRQAFIEFGRQMNANNGNPINRQSQRKLARIIKNTFDTYLA